MNKRLLYFPIFGLVAALLAWVLVPTAFNGNLLSVGAFALFAAASVFAGQTIERRLWPRLGEKRANSAAWRVGVRLAIYWLVPAAVLFLVGTLVPALFTLKAGFISALALTYCPLIVRVFVPEPPQS